MKYLLRNSSQAWRLAMTTQRRTLPIMTASRRVYHFSSAVSDPATVRLYRILLRQCRELEQQQQQQQQNNQVLLLQPPLNPHWAGISRVFESSLPHNPSAHHVLRLFGQWLDLELDHPNQTRFNQDTDAHDHDDNDDNDDNSSSNNNEISEGDKLIAWLAMIDQHGADPWMDRKTLWTTAPTIRQAIRLAFRSITTVQENNNTTTTTTSLTPMDYRSWAIRAYQYLSATSEMHRLIRTSEESGVRITTLARCVGRSVSTTTQRSEQQPMTYKYRFVYRIRIENTSQDRVFQLLGRSWIIQELRPTLADKGKNDPTGQGVVLGREESGSGSSSSSSIRVHAPHTGAVGKHPVLGPGQCFEYMSGCDLATPEGIMKGSFHFAWVQPGTPSAQVGQTVPALDEAHHDQRFEVPVTPFPLQPDRLPVQFGP